MASVNFSFAKEQKRVSQFGPDLLKAANGLKLRAGCRVSDQSLPCADILLTSGACVNKGVGEVAGLNVVLHIIF